MPGFSYGHQILWDDRGPNRFFLTYLFTDQAMAIEFLLWSKILCKTCGPRRIFASPLSGTAPYNSDHL